MTTRCKPGDMAWIKHSEMHPQCVGWLVEVVAFNGPVSLILAGGDGFAKAVDAGDLAREIVWAGQKWPDGLVRDLAQVADDDGLIRDLVAAVDRAKQRSAAAWAASGL